MKWHLDKPWMTEGERGTFRAMVDAGQVSFFRTKVCKNPDCNKGNPIEIPDVKEYCSKACWEATEGAEEQEQDDDEY